MVRGGCQVLGAVRHIHQMGLKRRAQGAHHGDQETGNQQYRKCAGGGGEYHQDAGAQQQDDADRPEPQTIEQPAAQQVAGKTAEPKHGQCQGNPVLFNLCDFQQCRCQVAEHGKHTRETNGPDGQGEPDAGPVERSNLAECSLPLFLRISWQHRNHHGQREHGNEPNEHVHVTPIQGLPHPGRHGVAQQQRQGQAHHDSADRFRPLLDRYPAARALARFPTA